MDPKGTFALYFSVPENLSEQVRQVPDIPTPNQYLTSCVPKPKRDGDPIANHRRRVVVEPGRQSVIFNYCVIMMFGKWVENWTV